MPVAFFDMDRAEDPRHNSGMDQRDWINEEIERLRLTQKAVADGVGMSESSLSRLLAKIRRLQADELPRFKRFFESVSDPFHERIDIAPIKHDDDEFQNAVAIIDVDVRIGLGAGGVPEIMTEDVADGDGAVRGYWKLPDYLLRAMRVPPQRIRVFEADGDSMRNERGGGVLDGDIVFVDIGHRIPSPPGIYALHDGFGVILKRLEIVPATDPLRVRVSSDNPKHEPRELCLDEINIIGRYLRRLTSS
jgi:hypothetical protein